MKRASFRISFVTLLSFAALMLMPLASADVEDNFPSTETIIIGTVGGGSFPISIETSNDVYRKPQEVDVSPAPTLLDPDTFENVTAEFISGNFPADIISDNDVYIFIEEKLVVSPADNIDNRSNAIAGVSSYFNTWDTQTGCLVTTHWDCVEEYPDDGDTSFVSTSTASEKESHLMEDITIKANYVDIEVTWEASCAKSASQAGGQIRHLVRETDGTPEEDVGIGAEFVCPQQPTYGDFLFFMENSPGGGEWTPAEINALECGYQSHTDIAPTPRVSSCTLRVVVVYSNLYQLDYRLNWISETCITIQVLAVQSFDGFDPLLIQVLDSTETIWTTRITVTRANDDDIYDLYTLTIDEWDSGSPNIRFFTNLDSDQGQAGIDDSEIRCVSALDYELQVKYSWSGVPSSGINWTLTVECKRVLNPENLVIQVLDSTETTWTTRYICNTDTDFTYSTYNLTFDELDGGTPDIRVIGADESGDTLQSSWDLDVIKIVRDFAPTRIKWMPFIVSAGISTAILVWAFKEEN